MSVVNLGTLMAYLKVDDQMSSGFSVALRNAQQFGQSMQTQGQKLRTIGSELSMSVTAPIVALGAAAISSGTDFVRTMNQVAAVTNASTADMKRLESAAMEWGQKTKYSATEAGEAMLELGKAGFSTDQTIKALPSTLQLAAAANLGLGEAANLTSNVMKTFKLETTDLARANDILAAAANASTIDVTDLRETIKYVGPIAAAAKVSLSDVAAASAELGEAGIKGSMAGTGLRNILTELMSPGKKTADILKDLGFGAEVSAKQMVPLTDVIEKLHGRTDATRLAMEMFGDRGGPAMALLAEKGAAALTSLSKNLNNSEGAAQRMADAAMKGLPGAIETMKGSIETASTMILKALAPSLEKGANLLGEMADFITNEVVPAFMSLPSPIQSGILVLVGLAAAAGPAMVAVGSLVKVAGLATTGFSSLVALGPKLVSGWQSFTAVALNPLTLALTAAAAAAAILYYELHRGTKKLEDKAEQDRIAIQNMENYRKVTGDNNVTLSAFYNYTKEQTEQLALMAQGTKSASIQQLGLGIQLTDVASATGRAGLAASTLGSHLGNVGDKADAASKQLKAGADQIRNMQDDLQHAIEKRTLNQYDFERNEINRWVADQKAGFKGALEQRGAYYDAVEKMAAERRAQVGLNETLGQAFTNQADMERTRLPGSLNSFMDPSLTPGSLGSVLGWVTSLPGNDGEFFDKMSSSMMTAQQKHAVATGQEVDTKKKGSFVGDLGAGLLDSAIKAKQGGGSVSEALALTGGQIVGNKVGEAISSAFDGSSFGKAGGQVSKIVGSVIPMVGPLIGMAVGAIVTKMKEGSVANDVRDAIKAQFGDAKGNGMADAASAFAGFEGVSKAYEAFMTAGNQKDVEKWADKFKASIEEANKLMGKYGLTIDDLKTPQAKFTSSVETLTTEYQKLKDAGFGDATLITHMASGIEAVVTSSIDLKEVLPESVGKLALELAKSGQMSHELAASLLGVTDAKVPWQDMLGIAQEFGIAETDLGIKFQNSKLIDNAEDLATKWHKLVDNGADVNAVMNGMAESANTIVHNAMKFGIEVPESMRGMLESMAKAGLLTDETGAKMDDLSKLKFAPTIESQIGKLVDAIYKLMGIDGTSGFGGVAGAAEAAANTITDKFGDLTIRVPVSFDVPDNPWTTGQGIDESGRSSGNNGNDSSGDGNQRAYRAGSGGVLDFGPRSVAELHGREEVLTESQGVGVASRVEAAIAAARSSGSDAMGDLSVVAQADGEALFRILVPRFRRALATGQLSVPQNRVTTFGAAR